MQNLKGKVAVVTGASSGIGLGIAKRLAAHGCHIVAVGRDQRTLDEAARLTDGIACAADVTDPDAMKLVAERALAEFGAIDILINNAGAGPVARLSDMTLDDWKWLIDLNLLSVVHGVNAILPFLRQNPHGGHILNTSSVAGMFTAPTIGAYSATKYAVVALSEALRSELEQDGCNIGVSVFLPGPVRSNIHNGMRNRPGGGASGGLRDIELEKAEGFEDRQIDWMDADVAGEIAVEGIRANRLYIWTHPDGAAPVLARLQAVAQSVRDSATVISS